MILSAMNKLASLAASPMRPSNVSSTTNTPIPWPSVHATSKINQVESNECKTTEENDSEQQQEEPPKSEQDKPVVSILKRSRSKSNTPRKVQFTEPKGSFGGKGQTEFQRTPLRRSHTKRIIPLGTFDTDSDHTVSDPDERGTIIYKHPTMSLSNSPYAKKIMANSRFFRKVKKKKNKRSEQEKQWLAMISPDVGSKFQPKTSSKQPPVIQINNASNCKNSSIKQSPSTMSRGQRALWVAQQKKNKKAIDIKSVVPLKQNTPSLKKHARFIKGTPIAKKVSNLVMRMAQNELCIEEEGNMADDDDDDDIMGSSNNNGSIPPSDETSDASVDTDMKEMTIDDDIDANEDDDLKKQKSFFPSVSNEKLRDAQKKQDQFFSEVRNDNTLQASNPTFDLGTIQVPSREVSRSRSQSQDISEQLNFDEMECDNELIAPTIKSVPIVRSTSDVTALYQTSRGTQTETYHCETGVQAGHVNNSSNNQTQTVERQSNTLGSQTDAPQLQFSNVNGDMLIVEFNGCKYMKIIESEDEKAQTIQKQKIKAMKVDKISIEALNDENKAPNDENIKENSNEATADNIALQSLSLNIPNESNDASSYNLRNRSKLKRKYDETMETETIVKDSNDCNQLKRRRLSTSPPVPIDVKPVKYNKGDLVWIDYENERHPTMIERCHYMGNERFYPNSYDVIWLNWVETSDDPAIDGKYIHVYNQIPSEIAAPITKGDLITLVKRNSINKLGWEEIKKLKPDIYNEYFDAKGKKRPLKKKKRRTFNRRASIA